MVGFVSVLGASVLGITVGLIAGELLPGLLGHAADALRRCAAGPTLYSVALTFIFNFGRRQSSIILFMINLVSQLGAVRMHGEICAAWCCQCTEREFVQAARSFGVRVSP
jgi:peptide/nickel transport system permease protein